MLLLLLLLLLSRFSRVRLFATPWTVAHQAPPSLELSRQKYWSGLPFPSPGDLPNLGIKPSSPALQADALCYEPPGKPLYPNATLFSHIVGKTRNFFQFTGVCDPPPAALYLGMWSILS